MPPLKNLKHEQFVQAYPHKNTAYEAYEATYHVGGDTSRANASRLMARPEIKNRLLEVFQEKGIDDNFIADGLVRLSNASKENVQLGAYRTILEVRKDIDSANKIGIQVNVETEKQERAIERLSRYSSIINKR